ncbi:MAG: D-alanine--D-alanine ligase [Verrucomicrobiota bacterium]
MSWEQIADKTIAIAMGGPGTERDVSLASAKSVREALEKHDLNLVGLDIRDAMFKVPSDVDLVFNVIHGTFGEDGQLQAILEEKGMPYTGAGVASSRLAFDKFESKERFVASSVPTPRDEVYRLSEHPDCGLPGMALPLVVKPPREGSSVGVHIVREAGEWAVAVEDAAKYGDELLVEEYVEGKELTVGILGGEALPVVHIQPRSGFYDMKNKYPWMSDGGGTDYFVPADLPEEVTEKVQKAAIDAHHSLNIEVYSRVDLLLDTQNEPYVLEVNTIPGMTESSLLPKAAAAVGIPYDELCLRIAELSLELRGPRQA